MNLESLALSEVSQRKTYDIAYMYNPKKGYTWKLK